jgi:arginase
MVKTKKRKIQSQSASLFGINDCHKPIKNTKKNYAFNKKTKQFNMSTVSKPYNYPNIILFPHKLGQTKHGVDKAPKYLNEFVNHDTHKVTQVKNYDDLFKNLNALYNANKKINGKRINIGGDHSMAIATIGYTMNKYPNAKVIYFDSHADLNTYNASGSKHYHGMPLSFVTGLDSDKKFKFIKNKLKFDNLLYIGGRCWDIFERDEALKHNIRFLEPKDINNHFTDSMNKILDFVGDSPVHISFDVDSIDPKYIPSTGTPVKHGIELKNAIKILDNLNNNSNIVNMDITELNMDLGSSSDAEKSGKNTVELFSRFLN